MVTTLDQGSLLPRRDTDLRPAMHSLAMAIVALLKGIKTAGES